MRMTGRRADQVVCGWMLKWETEIETEMQGLGHRKTAWGRR